MKPRGLIILVFSTSITSAMLCTESTEQNPSLHKVVQKMINTCCLCPLKYLFGIEKKNISIGGRGAARRDAYGHSDPRAFEDFEDETT